MTRPRNGCDTHSWLCGLLLVAAVALSYQPALRGGFVWDDDDNVTANANLRDFRGLVRIWVDPTANQQYYPLTHTSFWVERRLWGLNPFGYHLVNVGLHALASLLLWRALLLLEVPGAWLAAAIFAVHPLQAESVAWVTERKNTLSAVFFVAAALAGIKATLGTGGEAGRSGSARRAGAASRAAACCGLFLCAVFAKSVAGLLPVVLALVIWWKRGRLTRRDLLLLAPLALLGAAAGLHTAWLEQHHVGAAGPAFSRSPAERALIAGRAAWFYVGKLVLPVGLTVSYPPWRIDTADVAGWLYPASAAAVVAALWLLRGRVGRGPVTAVLYYGTMIFPALGFFNLYIMRYSYVQDHLQYLAGIGPIALAAAGLSGAIGRVSPGGRVEGAAASRLGLSRAGAAALALLLLAPLVAMTRQRSTVFRDSESLWRDTLARNPGAWIAHNNLGVMLTGRGQREEALHHLREALRLRPDLAEIHASLCAALLANGEPVQALEHCRRAADLDPGMPAARVGIGAVLESQGRLAQAAEEYGEALRLKPDDGEAGYRLARASYRLGQLPRAASLVEQVLRGDPEHAKAQALMGDVLAAQGRGPEAERRFREAIRLAPRDFEGHLGLGVLLASRGDLESASASFSQAAALRPGSAEAHYNLGKVLDLQGKTAEAARSYRLALAADPDLAAAHNNLGVDLLLLGETGEGQAHLREAIRLRPDFREARTNLEQSRRHR